MDYAYLGANAISLTIWAAFFLWRKDLRRMMVIMSFCAMPLAFFDLLFVDYWVPVTLFGIPIGIEGFLYSFSAGGIAAVVYAEVFNRRPRHAPNWRTLARRGLWIPFLAILAFFAAYGFTPNPEIAAYIAIGVGVALTLYLRRDLTSSALLGATIFGVIYFISLKLWVVLFPDVVGWFSFDGLPKFFIWGVPGWEAIFGFFFGAFWANLYEVLFGYRLAPLKSSRSRGVRNKAQQH